MHKKKIYLYGKHSNRTPFNYPVYKKIFLNYFEYTDTPGEAEYLVTGFRADFVSNAEEVYKLVTSNPSLKLVVFSEEPLWDTLWSGDFQKPRESIKCKIDKKEITINYYVLNHVTSDIFKFDNIPYFITTCDDYYIRYVNFFSRNIKLKKDDFQKNWNKAKIKYAFYAAKRIEENYDVSYCDNSILGINRYRSLIAKKLDLEGIVREGEGWSMEQKRQSLPDWHLDKLASLDKNSFIVSALENTHLSTYISEKLFDAFAVQSIPIYYAQKKHEVFRLVDEGSFINLADKSIEEAIQIIEDFTPDNEFMSNYNNTQRRFSQIFSNVNIYLNERKRVVNETIKSFDSL